MSVLSQPRTAAIVEAVNSVPLPAPALVPAGATLSGAVPAALPRLRAGHRLMAVARRALPSLPSLPDPPARYPRARDYLEPSRMAREMYRL
ncbi:hypothetical protein MHIB_05230 [Mycolicibacter hiberniae]|uniref:Uncharacterized protein n=1 Tax=Mycolicibacter hiberniae TaxID=29314 RepID=A0A7I7WYZ4_9MYCO|nr:hypothetical protein MHIB_05230 [Mycolicibacter hiberniae]